mmetsp:Transcript_25044/g.69921  ORF Transcript_25044/g.69921 Transcript_25044/m.69921 type:complete len:221 (+) Transcript_25044:1883-2545(+)
MSRSSTCHTSPVLFTYGSREISRQVLSFPWLLLSRARTKETAVAHRVAMAKFTDFLSPAELVKLAPRGAGWPVNMPTGTVQCCPERSCMNLSFPSESCVHAVKAREMGANCWGMVNSHCRQRSLICEGYIGVLMAPLPSCLWLPCGTTSPGCIHFVVPALYTPQWTWALPSEGRASFGTSSVTLNLSPAFDTMASTLQPSLVGNRYFSGESGLRQVGACT